MSAEVDRPMRPEDLLETRTDHRVTVSARISRLLLDRAGLRAFYAEHRGRDRELDATLHAMSMAARAAPADGGPVGGLSTTQAAKRLGISERSVRRACVEGRLPATLVGSYWSIALEDVAAFRPRGR